MPLPQHCASARVKAATPTGPFYVDQNTIDTKLETEGFAYKHRHVDIYSALCLGLRRRGVRTSETGSVMYWRFKCDVLGTNARFYTLNVSTTLELDNYWYRHILSARLEY